VDQRELVERAGRGDHDAFALLAGASVARLEAMARLILRDGGLAQDALQEALIRARSTGESDRRKPRRSAGVDPELQPVHGRDR